jgi:DNA-binding transcriptional MerR regulator
MSTDKADTGYRIGAIARLTGIPADTLRVWERRYRLVSPQRSAKGARLYRREDVARLALMKRLVDIGHAIGSIAQLSIEALEERLASASAPFAHSPPGLEAPPRVAVLGNALAARLRAEPGLLPGVQVVGVEQDVERFRDLLRREGADVLVLEYPTVHTETAAQVETLTDLARAQRALVVYGFGRAEVVRRLDTTRMTPLRAPVEPSELRRWCLAGPPGLAGAAFAGEVLPSLGEPPAPRRFDAEALARLAGVSTTVRCECPHHLVDLVNGLSAFERYSAECESRSPEDAALHAYLHLTTARARALMEEALARVATAEGLV